MSYRTDKRSTGQFKKDILNSSIKEALIAVRLCCYLKETQKQWPMLVPTGIDFTGEYVQSSKVTIDPDYMIADKFVEITRSDKICSRYFHWKCPKIDNCIKNNISIVFVNGLTQFDEPNFLWLDKEYISKFTKKSIDKFGVVKQMGCRNTGIINKPAYRYEIEWFKDMWKILPKMPKNTPKEYGDIMSFIEKNHE